MPSPPVRPVAVITDTDGTRLEVGLDYGTVTFGYPVRPLFRLDADGRREFDQAYVRASHEADAAGAVSTDG